MNSVMERIIAAKKARRKRLAALPVPEKVRMLVQMQKLAAPLLRAQGRRAVVWKIGGKGWREPGCKDKAQINTHNDNNEKQ